MGADYLADFLTVCWLNNTIVYLGILARKACVSWSSSWSLHCELIPIVWHRNSKQITLFEFIFPFAIHVIYLKSIKISHYVVMYLSSVSPIYLSIYLPMGQSCVAKSCSNSCCLASHFSWRNPFSSPSISRYTFTKQNKIKEYKMWYYL